MEGVPLNPENDGEDSENSRKKKKKAESLAIFAIEPKAEADKAEPKAESWWEKLVETDKKPTDVEAKEPAEIEAAGEKEAPLEELSEPEKRHVEREIVRAEQAEEAPQTGDLTDSETAAVEAVASFRHKIIDEEKSADEAFEETVAEIEPELPAEAEPAELAEGEFYIPHDEAVSEEAPAEPPAAGSFGPPPWERPGHIAGPPPVAPENMTIIEQGNEAGAFILGGIIGYLIGRRRGRIKTQKRLLPIQRKLEKQVESLRQDIKAKEYKIAETARRAATRPRLERLADTKAAESTHETKKPRQIAVEPERIGRVIVTAEAETTKPMPAEVAKHVETLSRNELLDISQKIIVESTTLRQVYETHLIGEKGLRRLVAEHLRGGDVIRQLRRELLQHEIDFERDPLLRDKAHQPETIQTGGAALNAMLRSVNALSDDQAKEELAIYKARALHDAGQKSAAQKRQRLVDVALVSTIAILLALVVLLFISRR